MNHHSVQSYNYHVWANQRVIDHLKGLPKDIYSNEIESVFPSIAKVIEHVYSVDVMWLSVMKQKTFEETIGEVKRIREEIQSESLEKMESRFAKLSEEYRTFFNEVNLDDVITIQHPSSGSMDTPIFELVQHVVNHGTYHRGNITAMLHQQGHPGVPTDYAFFLYTVYKKD